MSKESDDQMNTDIQRLMDSGMSKDQAEAIILFRQIATKESLSFPDYQLQEWVRPSPGVIRLSDIPPGLTAEAYFEANRLSDDYLTLLEDIFITARTKSIPMRRVARYRWEKATIGRNSIQTFGWNRGEGPHGEYQGTFLMSGEKAVEFVSFILYPTGYIVPVNGISANGFHLKFDIKGDKVENFSSQSFLVKENTIVYPHSRPRDFDSKDFESFTLGVKTLGYDINELAMPPGS